MGVSEHGDPHSHEVGFVRRGRLGEARHHRRDEAHTQAARVRSAPAQMLRAVRPVDGVLHLRPAASLAS